MLSKVGNGTSRIYDEIPVFANTKVIDFGFEDTQLNANTRDGNRELNMSQISIMYTDAVADPLPITIKNIQVYTCKALDVAVTPTAMLCSALKKDAEFQTVRVEMAKGGTPDLLPD